MAMPQTEAAPAIFKTRAHSSIVAPVVKTSSTKSIFLFFRESGFLIKKAPWIFCALCSKDSPTCDGVFFILASAFLSNGIFKAKDSSKAKTSDWL